MFEGAGLPEPEADADWLLCHVTGLPRFRLTGAKEGAAPYEKEALAFAKRRLTREPLQYILGETGFYGFSVRTDKRALVPRADTEFLAEAAIALCPGGGQVLEVGTGSGALACAIALKRPDVSVTATDISPDALLLAKENARRLGANVRFCEADLFCEGAYQLIVSNPPYLSAQDMRALQPELAFEPALALFGGEDGLLFYRRLAKEAPLYLAPGGFLCLELGAGQAPAVEALLAPAFGKIQKITDYQGFCRVITAQLH